MNRKTIPVITIIALLLTAGIASGQSYILIEDFEDCNISNYQSNWYIEQNTVRFGSCAIGFNDTGQSGGSFNLGTGSKFSGTPDTISFWYYSFDIGEDAGTYPFEMRVNDANGGAITKVFMGNNGGNGAVEVIQSSSHSNVYNENAWYHIILKNMDYGAETFDIVVTDIDGNEVLNSSENFWDYQGGGVKNLEVIANSNNFLAGHRVIDQFEANGFAVEATGYITDADGNALNGTKVDYNGTVDYTDNQGFYKVTVPEGTIPVTVSKTNYQTISKNITVKANQFYNFTLFTTQLDIEISHWMDFGATQSYSVTLRNGSTNKVTDVTANSTVTSSNSTTVKVFTTNQTLQATSNYSHYGEVEIKAVYGSQSVTENVTVANQTLANIDIMPSEKWVGSFLGFDENDGDSKEGNYGIGSEMQWLYFVIMIMAAVTLITRNAWVGLGTGEFLLIILWAIGYVSLGMVTVATYYAIFTGLMLLEAPSRNTVKIE